MLPTTQLAAAASPSRSRAERSATALANHFSNIDPGNLNDAGMHERSTKFFGPAATSARRD
jgi:hypothetical protein